MIDIFFEDVLGPKRFLVWSKKNELWRTFYRTTIAGHWDKDDVEEFNKCSYLYEIHLQHGVDDLAHLFCMLLMERCPDFKAAKVSILAVNDMKVIILLGRSTVMKERVSLLAGQCDFELARIRDRNDPISGYERFARKKMSDYLGALSKAYAPMATNRAKRGS